MTKLEGFEFDNVLIDERSHEIILIYDISYKNLIGPKHLRIIFHKIDVFISICDGTRYLVLLAPEKYHAICNRVRYLISLKSSITYVFLTITQKSKLILATFCL